MDLKFFITRVRRGYRDHAMRLATFLPVLGKLHEKSPVVGHRRLLHRWREFLTQLAADGWVPRGGDAAKVARDIDHAANCPPFGVRTEDKSRPCRLRLFCPQCWARVYVGEAYHHFVAHLYDPAYTESGEGPDGPAKVHVRARLLVDAGDAMVVTHAALRRFPHAASPRLDDGARLALALSAAARVVGGRGDRARDLRRYPQYSAAVVLYRVALEPECVTLARVTVLVAPRDAVAAARPSAEKGVEASRRRVARLTKRNLAVRLGAAFAYPEAMLRTSAQEVSLVNGLFRGARMLGKYGPACPEVSP